MIYLIFNFLIEQVGNQLYLIFLEVYIIEVDLIDKNIDQYEQI